MGAAAVAEAASIGAGAVCLACDATLIISPDRSENIEGFRNLARDSIDLAAPALVKPLRPLRKAGRAAETRWDDLEDVVKDKYYEELIKLFAEQAIEDDGDSSPKLRVSEDENEDD